uniref:Uncharacterized protein n=1 Tax=Candidatus Kentrum sp. UNK TaxID=2126344 RepID=A0A451A3Z5_9GAMM|nr:MAG: hypothetical protein BECKUNK1418G_GA0071005_101310 [Candidatus Kentron sp. UNK]VFK69454.1 MAG: hypothetical protein BECKUNK1418H_GA0071006_101410 [Candidatus Kentron sp. UNK]
MKNTAFDHEKFCEEIEQRLGELHNPRFFAAFAAWPWRPCSCWRTG